MSAAVASVYLLPLLVGLLPEISLVDVGVPNPVRTDTLKDSRHSVISPYQRPVRHRVLGGVVNDTGPPLTLCRKVYPYKVLPVG